MVDVSVLPPWRRKFFLRSTRPTKRGLQGLDLVFRKHAGEIRFCALCGRDERRGARGARRRQERGPLECHRAQLVRDAVRPSRLLGDARAALFELATALFGADPRVRVQDAHAELPGRSGCALRADGEAAGCRRADADLPEALGLVQPVLGRDREAVDGDALVNELVVLLLRRLAADGATGS